jgi:glutathione synthase/RimK-type ligase-like ATP-grasp enzyme
MPVASLVELLVSGRQREADLLYRKQIRRKPFLLFPNFEQEPRVLRLVAGDRATIYLGGDGREPGALMDGHWEADHFLTEQKLGTIVGCVFDDSDPARLVRFLQARERQIVVNCIADPDLYPETLAVAEQLVRMARLPVINSPASILMHSRDAVARRLRGIANLIVPETIRVTARTGQRPPFGFPFIGRKCGTQGGQTMELIGDRGEFDTFLRRHDGQQVYLTEFVDFRSKDGLYRKYRVRVVGNEIVPNHLFAGPQWKIHGHASREFMSVNPACVAEERAYLAEPLADHSVLREIHRRIGVDFYGIDYAVLSSGSVVFFEGNAAMRSIYPEWRDRFPETWSVTQELIRLFVHHLKSKNETHGNDSSPGAQFAPTT